MSAGIDYGLGKTNIDVATGIRYGVIHENSLNQDAISDIRDNGENLTYAAAVAEARSMIAGALSPVLSDLGVLSHVSKYMPRKEDQAKVAAEVDAIVDSVWSDIEDDWNDQYQGEDEVYRYDRDGYILQTTDLGLYVTQSPFYTFAAFCSPCCPGAGDLDHPTHDESGVKTYCLGPEWFDDNGAPYRVYRVADNTELMSGEVK